MIRLERPVCPYPLALENRNYSHPLNKAALRESTHGKCMYCESKTTHVNFGDVEHIKPKAPDLFPHLEFEWANLGFVCDLCNTAKGSKYNSALEFIDPYTEDPADQIFACANFLVARNASERGEWTILEIGLNRAELVEHRGSRIRSIIGAFYAACRISNAALRQSAFTELSKEALADKEFSFFVKACLLQLEASLSG
jgi:hypothetical protein